MTLQFSSPQQIADAGERIYQKIQPDLEKTSFGRFIAIDVTTEAHHVADTAEEALEAAKTANPSGQLHLIRVGFSGAFQIGYVNTKPGSDWLSR